MPPVACRVAAASSRLGGLLLLAGCTGPVEIPSPDLDAADATACAGFVDDLPKTLAEQSRVDSEPADAPGAAYGDPPIVVTCGVGEPEGFGPGASCEIAEGVRWYLPTEQYGDEPRDLTLTAAWDARGSRSGCPPTTGPRAGPR